MRDLSLSESFPFSLTCGENTPKQHRVTWWNSNNLTQKVSPFPILPCPALPSLSEHCRKEERRGQSCCLDHYCRALIHITATAKGPHVSLKEPRLLPGLTPSSFAGLQDPAISQGLEPIPCQILPKCHHPTSPALCCLSQHQTRQLHLLRVVKDFQPRLTLKMKR